MKDTFRTRLRMFVTRARGTMETLSAQEEARLDAEMDDEMRFHIEMATQRNLSQGMSESEARRRALIAFGGVESMKEQGREEQRVRWFENIGTDVRFAIRSLRKSPAFTIAAVLTVALAIAANVSVFSVVNAVLLRPLPFPNPGDVHYVGWDWGNRNPISTATAFQYDFIRRNSKSLEAVATFDATEADLSDDTRVPPANGLRVTGDFFRVIGIRPARGRAFGEEEAREGSPAVVVLGDAMWRTRYAADPQIVGRSILMNGEPHTVIGIMPPSYRFPLMSENLDYIVPFARKIDVKDEGHNSLVLARARHDWSEDRRVDDIARVSAQFRAEHPELASPKESYHLFTHAEAFASDIRTTLLVLLGAVLFVLLIGCANTANLLLVRASGRQREIAIRAVLGAGKRRLVQQLLTEGLVLSFVAAIIGVVAGSWVLRVLLSLAPSTITRADEIGLDGRVLFFVTAVAVASGLLFGLAAAVPALRSGLQETLRKGARGATAGRHARDVLVLAETALAVVLLAGAGLLMTSFARLSTVDAGFDPNNVLAVRLGRLPSDLTQFEAQGRLEESLLARIRAVPGVEAAAVASNFPLERGYNFPMGPVDNEELAMGDLEWRGVTPGYFEVLNIKLQEGRTFNERDTRASPHVAIVNETLARRFWPGQNAIGKHVYVGRFKGKWLDSTLVGETEIVGVARDLREIRLNIKPKATLMVPRAQATEMLATSPQIIVRAHDINAVVPGLRAAIAGTDPRLGAPEIQSMREIVSKSVAEPRFRMLIIGVFAACALLLAAIGIYGVIAAAVQQSTREIGVRMALGATRSRVALGVLRRCFFLVAGGALIGTVLALGLTRFMNSMLFGVTAADPRTFASVIVVLCAVGAIAGYIPSRRASRVDPGVALRAD